VPGWAWIVSLQGLARRSAQWALGADKIGTEERSEPRSPLNSSIFRGDDPALVCDCAHARESS